MTGACTRWQATAAACAALWMLLVGCRARQEFHFDPAYLPFPEAATQAEFPDLNSPDPLDLAETRPPLSVGDLAHIEYRSLSLEEAIQIALGNSRAMRELGVRVVATPAVAGTVFDPAITETDPRVGVEAALAAFDAQFSTSLFVAHNNRRFNNILFGGGTTDFDQHLNIFLMELRKTAATGTTFAMRNVTSYDRNNAPPILLRFPSSYETVFEAEVRHPLLQGGGIDFNRIAGPYAQPGVYNGVLIARTNTDVSLADFEMAVRDLLASVEQAYWDLYVAYRDADAKTQGAEAALGNWRSVERKVQAGTADLEQEARAREQFYLLEAQRLNALTGTSAQIGVRTGVFALERQLRRMIGLRPTDGQLIRPSDAPPRAEFRFGWQESLDQALWRRVELRRQRWIVKRRELELAAARNFEKMRLDVVAQYRWRGLGDDLFGGGMPQSSAFQDLFDGDIQESRIGFELLAPVGNRVGHAAARNAQFKLARERAILSEQELTVTHELSDAVSEMDRLFAISQLNFNRFVAARQQSSEIQKKYEGGSVPIDFFLDAQRRAVEAESIYHLSTAQYAMAIASVHRARGSMLEYCGVVVSESPFSGVALQSAARTARRLHALRRLPATTPRPISAGPVDFPATDATPFAADAGVEPPEVLPDEPPPLESESAISEPGTSEGARGMLSRPDERQALRDIRLHANAESSNPAPGGSPLPERTVSNAPSNLWNLDPPRSGADPPPASNGTDPGEHGPSSPPLDALRLVDFFQDPPATEGAATEAPAAEGSATEGPLGRAPTSNDQVFLRRRTVLLDPGQVAIDYGVAYLWRETDRLTVIDGALTSERLRNRRIVAPLSVRLGVADGVQFFANLPHGIALAERSSVLQGDFNSVIGLADIGGGFTAMLMRSTECRPDVTATVSFKAPTGPDAFREGDNNPFLGNGFWGISSELTVIQSISPAVLFGSIGFEHEFTRNHLGVDVNPGELIDYQFGMGLAINESLVVSTTFSGALRTVAKFDGVKIPSSIQEPFALRFSLTRILRSDFVAEPFVRFALNNDTDQAAMGLVFTHQH